MIVSAILLIILFYPMKFSVLYDDELKIDLYIFSVIKIPINYHPLIKKYVTQRIDRSFDFSELYENTMKVLNSHELLLEYAAHSKIKKLEWYSDIPLEIPVVGFYMYESYTIFQSYILTKIDNTFKKIELTKIDSNVNPFSSKLRIYVDIDISTNLFNSIFVSLKNIKKLPILLKRVS